MTEGVSSSEDAAAARAAEQARLRKQRREAKIKAGGPSRLDKITGLGGGIPKELPSQPTASTERKSSEPAASIDGPADPEEVDISQHYYAPQTTARFPPGDSSNVSEAQLRQMMLGLDGTPPPGGRNPFLDGGAPPMAGMEGMEGMGQDQMMQMISKMMAGGMPGGPSGPDGSSPFAGTGLEGLFGAAGGANPMQQQAQQAGQNKSLNFWRILHAIFALGLGIYVAISTTFTGTKIERDAGELQSTGILGAENIEQARAWFFYVFTSVEAALLTSRYMADRGTGFTPSGWTWSISGMLPDPMKGYARHALRYAQIFSAVRNDALLCVFVMGVCCLLRY
ncbi:hypothetical protein F5Y19DRAFT_32266 [Xylariaceae sp. FL1651]|nr:hypothetical protein F5Y19DRAFT_32266 [Xylariaceae sp. FL1651]